MTAASTEGHLRAVGANFVSRYFELFVSDPKQLMELYVPTAVFNHDNRGTGAKGTEAIRRSLTRLYPKGNHGCVSLKDLTVTKVKNVLSVSVNGTYYRLPSTSDEGEEFKHHFELVEHDDSGRAYGILSDVRRSSHQREMKSWATETPPMFAKTPAPEVIPPLQQPPAADSVAAGSPAAESVAPARATAPPPPPPPPQQQQTKPQAQPQPAESAEAAHPTTEASAPAPLKAATAERVAPVNAAEEADTPSAEKRSFAEMLRTAAAKPTGSGPVRIEARGEEAKREKETSKESEGRTNPSERKPRGGQSEGKREEDGKRGGNANRSSRPSTNYDIIIKGLPQDASEASVTAMIAPYAAVSRVSMKSQPDKRDTSLTRIFAFILLDREAITKRGDTLASAVATIVQDCRAKYLPQRIYVEEVRERQQASHGGHQGHGHQSGETADA